MKNYRNYIDEEVNLFDGVNVLSGENAQGKTNFLEALYYLTCGKSFRTRFDRELIRFGSQDTEIEAGFLSGGREQSLIIRIQTGRKKQILCNGAKINATELSERLKAVLFCPEDLNLIRDGPAARRRFMDMAISQMRPVYAQFLSEYHKLFESKSRILVQWRNQPSMLKILPSFSERLCAVSARMIRYRASFVERLSQDALSVHEAFTEGKDQLSLQYRTVSTVNNPFLSEKELFNLLSEHQKAFEDREIASGRVLSGIHKDDIEILMNGQNARSYASQGQTRTAALSMILAEREMVLHDIGEYPILLLDDVLSELDERRQNFVLKHISGGQTLITSCDDGQISQRTGGRVFQVVNGKISHN